ncbi:MAG: tetratricopeptide repeat protein [Candidatus Omnitrophica bacterium]|nr:tetratricopeptide repeat protein [Candidatus Omnitrophota bacterium]MDD5351762.1 tetratricopeptide repeat protein [Candidatus Omnitrophota bacterium]MDD5550973.1 tetratricopeptide repeat protein [Candidatus Omnitrophota bacterium]
MNRKISMVMVMAIFAILFYSIYFTSYASSATGTKSVLKTAIVNMHCERGVRLYKTGNYDKAIEEFIRALELDPGNAGAKKYLTASVKQKNKKMIDQLYKDASIFFQKNEYGKAIEAYKKVLEIKPNDSYSMYKIESLNAVIEKEDKLKQNDQYKESQRAKELEKVAKEKAEKERLLKQQAEQIASEVARKEKANQKAEMRQIKEKQIKEIEQMINEKIDEGSQEEEAPAEGAVSEGKSVSAPKAGPAAASESSLSKEGRERSYKIKLLFELGKKYYNMSQYRRAIEAFQQAVDLEAGSPLIYTAQAKEYIDKSKDKIRGQIRQDKVREIEDIENEMINRVIEAAKLPTEPISSTITRDVIEPTIETVDIRKKMVLPVDMDFQDVDVVYVLDYLSETTGANIVMSSAVTKGKHTVSVKIKDMPLEEALKYVLKSSGLTYRIDKNVVWIATPEEMTNEQMETKVFTLKKGKGAFTEFKSATTGSVGLGSAADVDKVTTIKDIIEKALTWPSGAKIVLDERLGALIVTNTPYNLELVEKILEKIDVEPIQVLIEARFLEISVTDLNELGIDWQINSALPIDKARGEMVHGIAANSGVNFTDTTRQTEGFNFTYQGLLTKPQFQVVLHTLEESKKVKTLSAPRITTLDNQMATMKVVDEWIYPTRYEFQIVQFDLNGDGDFGDANETLYKNVPSDFVKRDVGILLRVTPSVGMDDNTITLTLIPEVSDGTAGYFSYTGDVSLPLFTSRNLSTSVVVNNGDTVVLGGLIKETQTKVRTKVPILGDLPWVGAIFRKDTDSIMRKNLLIFVTATILSSKGEGVALNKTAPK